MSILRVNNIYPYNEGEDWGIRPTGSSGGLTFTPTGSVIISGSGGKIILPPDDTEPIYIGNPSGSISINPSGSTVITGSVVISGSLVISGSTTISASCDCGCQPSICTGSVSASVNVTEEVFKIVSGSSVYTKYDRFLNSYFIGLNAGRNTTTVQDVQFIGQGAGAGANNSNFSVMVGSRAGSGSVASSYSTFVGANTGFNATNASSSVFIGSGAGSVAYSASNAVFIGDNAGNSSTDAYNAVAIGYYAGNSSFYANNSVAIGSLAGTESALASNSIFMGVNAGRRNPNASHSIYLGWQAGRNLDNISNPPTSGPSSNNIIIGTNITLKHLRGNAINIGGIIFGTGSYSDINSTPFSGSANGKIGINVVEPTTELDVSGSVKVSNVLTLAPQHPLPAASSYPNSFAVSSSTPPVPYFSDGTSWNALY